MVVYSISEFNRLDGIRWSVSQSPEWYRNRIKVNFSLVDGLTGHVIFLKLGNYSLISLIYRLKK